MFCRKNKFYKRKGCIRIMKKLFRSTLAVAGAFAMAVTSVAAVPTVAKADFNSAYAVFNPSVLHDGEVHYTIAGGMTGWATLGKANTMKKTDITK